MTGSALCLGVLLFGAHARLLCAAVRFAFSGSGNVFVAILFSVKYSLEQGKGINSFNSFGDFGHLSGYITPTTVFGIIYSLFTLKLTLGFDEVLCSLPPVSHSTLMHLLVVDRNVGLNLCGWFHASHVSKSIFRNSTKRSFESDTMTSHKHGLTAKHCSKWRPPGWFLSRRISLGKQALQRLNLR